MPSDLSVVIPAFNEAKRLGLCLGEARAYLEKHFAGRYRIFVVDDGSTDGTAQVAQEALGTTGEVIVLPRNCGKGAAVRAGMLAAKGQLRLFCDADGATPFHEIDRLLRVVEAGVDVAFGSRAKSGGKRSWNEKTVPAKEAEEPPVWHVRPHRHLMGRVFSRIVKMGTGLRFQDTQCGFKLFRGDVAELLFTESRIDGFAFDVEILYLAQIHGFHAEEVAVSWHEVAGSKVHVCRDSWRMLKEIAHVRRLHG